MFWKKLYLISLSPHPQLDKNHLDEHHKDIFIELCTKVLETARAVPRESNESTASDSSELTVGNISKSELAKFHNLNPVISSSQLISVINISPRPFLSQPPNHYSEL